MMREGKARALEALDKAWAAKDLPLQSAATQVVPGEGNPDADIMFVGEAPGQREDELGRPFVGPAGKYLDELLAAVGLKRDEVFIANVIKHRPPGNRDPLPQEVDAYGPWLLEQIRIIDPKLIVTLGRFSMDYLLGPGHSITKIHGQPKRKAGRVIMPVYHPAAVLYKANWRPILEADFKKIPRVLALITEGTLADPEASAAPATEKQASLL